MAPAQTSPFTVRPGSRHRLGARVEEAGTNFAVWAPDATRVVVCLFDDDGLETRLDLPTHALGVWHGYVAGVGPGHRYGFRVDGPWDPLHGHVFNVDKLLLDPYARAVDGSLTPHPTLATMTTHGEPNPGDTAGYVPRSVVAANNGFDWGEDRRPDVPWRRTVIYEAHVRGFSRLNQAVPEHQRGTFAGLGHPVSIDYLRDLGVTSLELLPVQHFLSETWVTERGQSNYWGYNPIAYFAPHAGYASTGTRGEQIDEFRQLVKDLHAAGIELLLDVVYNHTAEAGQTGPAVCFRGYDDGSYYRSDGWGRYADVTGCGNTLNVSEPQVLQLVMDSLRYWVTEMHVDGFRFDLAPALARNGPHVDMRSPFLTAVHQDPVLRDVKLIAEPWDATAEGYALGRFPPPWCEWNDKFRDTVRDFWRGQSGGVRDLASRLSGSSDLYADDGRLPFSSVNFVTAHDGFTVRDLVSYATKHNDGNLESGRDGTDGNRSWNCGIEGDTDDPAILALRRRQAGNLLATVLVATGVPMITAGDERGRTQGGNNNAFCQDNETSWLSWETDPRWRHLHALTRRLLQLRAARPVLRQRYSFDGKALDGDGRKDITWLRSDGQEMDESAWHDPGNATLGAFLDGDAVRAVNSRGERRHGSSYLVWLHAGTDAVDVTLPASRADLYVDVVRTDREDMVPTVPASYPAGTTVRLLDRSFALFEAVSPAPA